MQEIKSRIPSDVISLYLWQKSLEISFLPLSPQEEIVHSL